MELQPVFDLAACTQPVRHCCGFEETFPSILLQHHDTPLFSESAAASQTQHHNIIRKVSSRNVFRSIWDGKIKKYVDIN